MSVAGGRVSISTRKTDTVYTELETTDFRYKDLRIITRYTELLYCFFLFYNGIPEIHPLLTVYRYERCTAGNPS